MNRSFFSGEGLDRADALRADPVALAEMSQRPDARELVWRDGMPAISRNGSLEWRPVQSSEVFLGLALGEPRFSAIPASVEGFRAAPKLLAELSAAEGPIFACALSLAGWHLNRPFCAKCGGKTQIIRGGWSRRCASCAAEHFPRVDPVVIMLAHNEGEVILGRQPHFPAGRYSALAGFVEAGEAIEDAVSRELHEEVGIRVSEVRYITSQPWPFPSSLMIACVAEASTRALKIDRAELEDARWFSRNEVAAALAGHEDAAFKAPPQFAVARMLMEGWVSGELDGDPKYPRSPSNIS